MITEQKVLPDISDHKYTIQVAKSEDEIEEALRLRYNVFYKELKREFDSEKVIDRDQYDDQCHHLIVKENKSGRIVGTYRLQTYELASDGAGFYSDRLFVLDSYDETILTEGVEIGRACIEPDHRNGRVLFLLWKGLAGYLKFFQKRYLFGNLGIPVENAEAGLIVYEQFKRNSQLHDKYLIPAREPYRYSDNGSVPKAKEDEIKLTTLLQNYIDVGCKISSQPAYHKELELFYVMILLDIETITPRIRRMFFN